MRKLLAVLLMAMPLFGDVIIEPPRKGERITKLRLILTTGADDLRRNSAVSAFLILKDGRRVESKPLNCNRKQECNGFPARSRRTLEWTLDAKGTNVRPEDLYRLGLAFKSGKAGPLDGPDNWDLSALEVEYVAGGDTTPLLKLSNRGGIYRFKNVDEWTSEPIRR